MATIQIAGVDLTPLEAQAMKIGFTEYGDLIEEGGQTWVFAWADATEIPMTVLRGVMSSLVKKGLIKVFDGENSTDLEVPIEYTALGREVCRALNNIG